MKHRLISSGFLLIPILLLLVGAYFLFVPSQVHRAFAGRLAPTCANTYGTIMADCEKQPPILPYPVLQNCADDGKSVKILPAYHHGVLVGEVDLRHSNTCHSYWTRTIAYSNSVGLIINVEANITFNDGLQDNQDSHLRESNESLDIFTAMTYKNVPPTASGIFDLSDGTSITLIL